MVVTLTIVGWVVRYRYPKPFKHQKTLGRRRNTRHQSARAIRLRVSIVRSQKAASSLFAESNFALTRAIVKKIVKCRRDEGHVADMKIVDCARRIYRNYSKIRQLEHCKSTFGLIFHDAWIKEGVTVKKKLKSSSAKMFGLK